MLYYKFKKEKIQKERVEIGCTAEYTLLRTNERTNERSITASILIFNLVKMM